MTSLSFQLHSALAFLSGCPMILASPIFWNLHCNEGFIFPASCNDLLMGNLTPPHSLVGGSFWNCASLLDYFYVFHASKAITTWMILSSIACLKCSLIPLYYCYSGICLPLRLTQGTCFHGLPFWMSKLLWWCFLVRFSLLHEFHKLGFWMDLWGLLAFRELFLFPRCRTQDLSFTMLVWQLQKLYLPAPSLFHYTGHSPFLNKPQFSYIFGFSTYWLE